MMLVSEADLDQFEQQRAVIQQSILELSEMQKNDDPAVVEKFNNLLDITSRPTHLRMERRISANMITSPVEHA